MNRGFISFWSLVGLAVLGGLGYWAYTTGPSAMGTFLDSQLLTINVGQHSVYGGQPRVPQTRPPAQESTSSSVDTSRWEEFENKNSGVFFLYPPEWKDVSTLFYRSAADSVTGPCMPADKCAAFTTRNGIHVVRRLGKQNVSDSSNYFVYVIPPSSTDKSTRSYIFTMERFKGDTNAQPIFEAMINSVSYSR